MSDEVLARAEALTQEELAARFDHSTHIQIDHSVSRNVLKSEWVRSSAAEGAKYGYAWKRTTERDHESKLDVTVTGSLDVLALARVILDEIQRQHESRT